MKISVVIPTLNEEESIGETLEQIPRIEDMEIVIVDGLSKDRTREIAISKGARIVEEKSLQNRFQGSRGGYHCHNGR